MYGFLLCKAFGRKPNIARHGSWVRPQDKAKYRS